MNTTQSDGIKRVQNARRSRDFRHRIWMVIKTIFGAVRDMLFVMAVGCLIGIGFGVGVAFYACM